MDDRALVAAMVAGDPRGLEGAYLRYADRLYAYCRSVLRDGDAASDVVHDTFLIAAQRAGDLRDPERLRSWLYTIARNECLRALKAARRGAPLSEADEPAAEPADPTRAIHAEQLRELVRAATQGLSDRDREMIELAVRHDLGAAEVGTVLGLSTDHAHARLSRARAQLHRSLGALLVARAGGARCTALTELTRGWDGVFTPLLRKRVSRHIERCPRCSERQRELLNPAQLLPAYAALPFLPVPVVIWQRIAPPGSPAPTASPADPGSAAPGSAAPDPGAPGAPDPGAAGAPSPGAPGPVSQAQAPPGAPGPVSHAQAPPGVAPVIGRARVPVARTVAAPPEPGAWTAERRRSRTLPVVAAVLALLLLLGTGAGVTWWQTDGFRTLMDPGPAAAAPSRTAGPTLAPPSATLDPTPTPTSAPTPTVPPPVPTSTPTRPQLTVVAFIVTAQSTAACIGSTFAWKITVTATHNRPLDSALLYWETNTPDRVIMEPAGAGKVKATTETIGAASATWWVTAVAADGRETETEPVVVNRPC